MWSKHFVGVFLKRVTPEKVSVFKGFQRFRKLTAGNCLRAPKPSAIPLGDTPKYKIVGQSLSGQICGQTVFYSLF